MSCIPHLEMLNTPTGAQSSPDRQNPTVTAKPEDFIGQSMQGPLCWAAVPLDRANFTGLVLGCIEINEIARGSTLPAKSEVRKSRILFFFSRDVLEEKFEKTKFT